MADIKTFLHAAEEKAFDLDHRQKLRFNIRKYDETVVKGKQQYTDLESARKKAKNLKWRALSELDKQLLEFEKNFTRNGGKVIWAKDADEANREILGIIKERQAKLVVKGKSMATEELHLNDALEKAGITVAETDLGEYIVQLAGEKPYHIVTPAMHKSRADVAQLFHEKLGTPEGLSAPELVAVARERLRELYTRADVGITGANFIIPDTGSIAITENEGNARLCITFPKVHIAIVGIEKVIPTMNDLALFWPLLATYGTGQQVTVYNSIISGPKREGESDGPEEMYVILLDNGRTNLLAQTIQREALYCIRCGACLNACPVYKTVGGHAYDTTYSGPIGAVINPHLKGMPEAGHQSFASTLCGNCTEVCPVKINLHNLLVHNRNEFANEGLADSDKRMWKIWRRAMMNRRWMDFGGPGLKDKMVHWFFKDAWGKRRDMLHFPKKSFNRMWKEQEGK